jgi:hypothetical protein
MEERGVTADLRDHVINAKQIDETNALARARVWKRCSRRVHSRTRETLEVVLAHRLHLGRR